MTNKAKKLFDFIQSYIQKNGIAPSFDEMKNFMGLKSKSSIQSNFKKTHRSSHSRAPPQKD